MRYVDLFRSRTERDELGDLDVDNEISTLLNELKKNRKLKSLHLGRNFTNVKAK